MKGSSTWRPSVTSISPVFEMAITSAPGRPKTRDSGRSVRVAKTSTGLPSQAAE